MTASTSNVADVKWIISVPADFDKETRSYLASQGAGEEALSALVQTAVSRYILSALTSEAKERMRASGRSQKELEKIIEEGITWAKDQPEKTTLD
ncbi:MAG TPA: hypothetical protein IAC66_04115 [Candidatus Aphodousia gallistercoris]|nr:hypothetical protein [Candidatus Aphodousia gallistercoris]